MIEAIEAPALAEDSRFTDNAGRMANLKALVAALSTIFRKRSTAEWLGRLEAAGVPAGPVLSIGEMHRDPQTLAREMVVEPSHGRLGPVKAIGLAVKFSDTPGAVRTGAPVYGEHTREVLAEYGISETEVLDLLAEGAVVAA